jgi:hypothetical protein
VPLIWGLDAVRCVTSCLIATGHGSVVGTSSRRQHPVACSGPFVAVRSNPFIAAVRSVPVVTVRSVPVVAVRSVTVVTVRSVPSHRTTAFAAFTSSQRRGAVAGSSQPAEPVSVVCSDRCSVDAEFAGSGQQQRRHNWSAYKRSGLCGGWIYGHGDAPLRDPY